MNKKIEQAINNQIKEEMYSAYVYLSMAAWAENQNLPGFANWFIVQYKEELDHMMGFYNYLNEIGGRVKLQAIKQPPIDFKNLLQVAKETLKHEQFITDKINKLYELAGKEKHYSFQSFLKWYIDEQVEEEASANELVGKVQMIGDNSSALYMLDKELGSRVYSPASILKLNE